MWHVFHIHTFPRVFLGTCVSISVTFLFRGARVFLWGNRQHWKISCETGAPVRHSVAPTAQNPKPVFLMSGFSCVNGNICFSRWKRILSWSIRDLKSFCWINSVPEYRGNLKLSTQNFCQESVRNHEEPRRAERWGKFEDSVLQTFRRKEEQLQWTLVWNNKRALESVLY